MATTPAFRDHARCALASFERGPGRRNANTFLVPRFPCRYASVSETLLAPKNGAGNLGPGKMSKSPPRMEQGRGFNMRFDTDPFHETSPEAQRLYYSVLRMMTAEMKCEISMKLGEHASQSQLAGLRQKYPNYSEDEIKREYLRNILTPEQFSLFYPDGFRLKNRVAASQLEGNA